MNKQSQYHQLAMQLYEQEQLKKSYARGGETIPWEPSEAEAFVQAKVADFAKDKAYFDKQSRLMTEYERKLSEIYKSFVNEDDLRQVALGMHHKQNSIPVRELEKEYYEGANTALTWRHGRANPELSHIYFEINHWMENELLPHIMAEDKSRMLGRPRAEGGVLRRVIGEWKHEHSLKGKMHGKVELFLHDAPGSERYLQRLAAMAGYGLQHIKIADAVQAVETTSTRLGI